MVYSLYGFHNIFKCEDNNHILMYLPDNYFLVLIYWLGDLKCETLPDYDSVVGPPFSPPRVYLLIEA